MRKPKYISPTSLSIFFKDPTFYYLRYLAENKLKRDPQTKPMSVGSAFDAFVKNYLYRNLHGGIPDSKYELKTLFESQVQPHLRKWAWSAGSYVFNEYQKSGALADITMQMIASIDTPQFEFDVSSIVEGDLGVPFFGKPDLAFTNSEGALTILDFKVNGYCSRSGVSPKPGYLNLRAGEYWTGRTSSLNKPHKKAIPTEFKGTYINTAFDFEEVDISWATQCAIYSWCLGAEVGSPTIIGIDQICCKPDDSEFPELRFASHRGIVGKEFQITILRKAQCMWDVINSNHFFREMSIDDSIKRTNMLDNYALGLEPGESYAQKPFFL